jgi:hypothetical protein
MLSDHCIYTIKHSDDLHKTGNTGRAGVPSRGLGRMANASSTIVQKLWNYCNIQRGLPTDLEAALEQFSEIAADLKN